MAFPNVSDIVATTIESRSKKIADNVSKNAALLAKLNGRGNVKPVSGGSVIFQELSFAENANVGWYSGYDLLPTAVQDVLSAAQYDFKQAACPVVVSGLEQLQNAGREQMIDLVDGRVGVAEDTMMNLLTVGLYSDGTAASGKQLTGLAAAIAITPTSGTYGAIDRAAYPFWQNKVTTAGSALTASTIQGAMNTMWASLVRGTDRPDLISADNIMWSLYMASLQAAQRFTDPNSAMLGFPSIKFMDADVVLDGGQGGAINSKTMLFINTKYLFLRPHRERNMVPLSPNKRYATNQDAEVTILAWAGNLTTSNCSLQGRLITP
jgi:hypothetical protein